MLIAILTLVSSAATTISVLLLIRMLRTKKKIHVVEVNLQFSETKNCLCVEKYHYKNLHLAIRKLQVVVSEGLDCDTGFIEIPLWKYLMKPHHWIVEVPYQHD